MTKQTNRSDCPINLSLEAWGDKWSLLIIRDLMFEGKRTYGDFLKSPEKISTNILAARLKSLQEVGIIVASGSPDRGTKGYHLTQKGIDMLPMMLEVYLWTEKHYPIPEHVQTILTKVKADKAGFAAAAALRLQSSDNDAS